MTGPARILWDRRPTAQPSSDGVPACYRDLADEPDGSMCALAYAPETQQDLLRRSPGCERCQAGCNAAALFWEEVYRKRPGCSE